MKHFLNLRLIVLAGAGLFALVSQVHASSGCEQALDQLRLRVIEETNAEYALIQASGRWLYDTNAEREVYENTQKSLRAAFKDAESTCIDGVRTELKMTFGTIESLPLERAIAGAKDLCRQSILTWHYNIWHAQNSTLRYHKSIKSNSQSAERYKQRMEEDWRLVYFGKFFIQKQCSKIIRPELTTIYK
jgi:hypothetical protein